MRSIHRYLAIWALLLCACPAIAQAQGIEFIGKIVTSPGNSPIEYATIRLLDASSNAPLAGTTTDANGEFSLQSPKEQVALEISFIGFESQTIKDFAVEEGKVNLGTIALTETQVTMDEVVIQGEKSQMEFKLDKRVFHVGKDLSSTGASALEVLNNVPSVNVNIEGQISLRGSQGVQILINGKPSVIASEDGNILGTLTAEMIERIEVISNPSAKYEAEGTSGIINIVLKKDERKGINGSITLNGGIPHNHSIGVSLNRRTEKFNLFSQIGVGYRELPNDREFINEDLVTGTRVESIGEEFRNEQFTNIILGTDYHINDYNVLTLSGNFAYEVESQPSETEFWMYDGNGDLLSQWNRIEETSATNPKYQYEFQYAKDFKDHKDHDLIFSALGNFFGKSLTSDFLNTTASGESFDGRQQTESAFQEAKYTFKLDYTKPFSKQFTLETGSQYVINDVSNDFAVSNFVNGEWVPDQGLTNLFEYNQRVLGVYGTGAFEGERWGLKLGLRMEHTDLNTLLTNTGEANSIQLTNLFPSAHTSFKFNERFSMQAGYSRRIYRPRLWDLNPFFNIRNNFTIRTGNPELLPEFTDSYELTGIMAWEQVSFNVGVFHRYTTEVIERVSIYEDEVTRTMPVNLGTNRATGFEFNGKYTPIKQLSFNGDFNFLFFDREGTFENQVIDFSASRYSGKLTTKLKLIKSLDIEFTTRYESEYQTVQGQISDVFVMDGGVRLKILKGKGMFNLSVRDIFASRVQESWAYQPTFTTYSRRQRGRFITLGFSYGFGKGEAMEFSAQKRR
ncbi:outer membrane beta-barrel family protein [Pontibacter sp. G13]|uniref:outer membrane beta-barrel family protein n=1 Tax=Pontibacter sp. G13 TaxID=3074898 RepID=UPI002889AD68|nr:outer membrane beta-barrel family protein [Pontibacter sp. G13]WNJ20439.1 outer membrane beta-barrel family protein [Pontibacter sp. G13]